MHARHVEGRWLCALALLALAACGGKVASGGSEPAGSTNAPPASGTLPPSRGDYFPLPTSGPAPEGTCDSYTTTSQSPNMSWCSAQVVSSTLCGAVACEWTVFLPRCPDDLPEATPEQLDYLCTQVCREEHPSEAPDRRVSTCRGGVDARGNVTVHCGSCARDR